VEGSLDFIILFVPTETIFSAALRQDPELLEYGVSKRILLATPTTLIAILRAVAWGWQEKRASENAEEVFHLGRELYGKLLSLCENMGRLKRSLDSSVEAYNRLVGTFDEKVLPASARFQDLGIGEKESQPALEFCTSKARGVQDGDDLSNNS